MASSFAGLYQRDQAEIARERARLLYEKLPFTLVSNLVIGLGLVSMLWNSIPHAWLLGWLASLALLGMGRIWLWRKFQKIQATAFEPRPWFRLFTASALLAGGLVGASGLLFFQLQSSIALALSIFLGLISLGAVATHAAHRPAHLLYVLPAVLPFSLRALAEQSLPFVAMGLGELLFLPVTLSLSKRTYRKLIESIELRFHNQHLLAEVTRQKELAESAQRQAELANAAKTRFFAAASHDLRQPVQALEFLGAALEQSLTGRDNQPLAVKIRSAGRELSDLLNALLDFSKIDAGGSNPLLRDFPLAPLFQRMADEFSSQAAARGLQCRVRSCSAWVRSDALMLERIVRNLMSNALKYTPTGKILLGCRRVGSNLRIEVHDTGIGIPRYLQQEVFSEFVQLDNPERDRQKGLGLGLAIVDSLARQLGHVLTLRSVPGRGSRFAVTVPLGVPCEEAGEEAPSGWSDLRGGSAALVLLVEDDQLIREGASQLLENWGYAVLAVESEAQALAALRLKGVQPDVILADYRLREGSTGVQVIQSLQAHCGCAVPAAIITGDITPEHLAAVRAAGFPVLSKPLAAAKLRALLGNLLRAPNPEPAAAALAPGAGLGAPAPEH